MAPQESADLHGSAPDSSPVAVLLVDVINPFEFPEADLLLSFALPAAERLADLKRRASAVDVPIIYANDNFGRWRSDHTAVVDHCLKTSCKGRPIAELLRPSEKDYFVLKPKHSAFFSTTLDTLLRYLKTKVVVIGGFASDICVLFTANDAYMRDLHVVVAQDGVASNFAEHCEGSLDLMKRVLKADVAKVGEIDLRALLELYESV